jgi:hypothetical protein
MHSHAINALSIGVTWNATCEDLGREMVDQEARYPVGLQFCPSDTRRIAGHDIQNRRVARTSGVV